MPTYLAILRGINVSGQRKIPMADLKQLLAENGFNDVITYIQSGNVVFRHDSNDGAALARQLEKMIEARFGFDVPVMVRTAAEWQAVPEQNPFLKQENVDVEKLHVTLLESRPDPALLEKIAHYDFAPDVFQIIDRTVYLYIPGGYGNTKLSNAFFENKLKVKATTRNWKTVQALANLAGE